MGSFCSLSKRANEREWRVMFFRLGKRTRGKGQRDFLKLDKRARKGGWRVLILD